MREKLDYLAIFTHCYSADCTKVRVTLSIKGGKHYGENIDDLLRVLTFEVLSAERRNLRSKALTDQKMSEEIQKIIIDNLRTR